MRLIVIFFMTMFFCSHVVAKPNSHQSKASSGQSSVVEDSDLDEFGASAQEDNALGPKINYPKKKTDFYSSSQRSFTGGQVNTLPFQTPAQALEIVPGLAVGH
jgi:hypothetical protein